MEFIQKKINIDKLELQNYFKNLPSLYIKLREKSLKFRAGKVAYYSNIWPIITKDKEVLETVKSGLKIEFEDKPVQTNLNLEYKFSEENSIKINNQIQDMLKEEVISFSNKGKDDFYSPIFFRDKKDGSVRIILDLTQLNLSIKDHHHKLETLKTALEMIEPNDLFTSLDLKAAYYSIPLCETDKKYFKFMWQGISYQYNVCANGLCSVPRVFSKIVRQVMAFLRLRGHRSTFYLDDSLLMGCTQESIIRNTLETLNILEALGFTIHPEKSVLKPATTIKYLGFILDSKSMKVNLTEERKDKIKKAIENALANRNIKIRTFSSIIGLFVAAFPAVMYGPLNYRYMEKDKTENLKINAGNFDKYMTISDKSVEEINWWKKNIDSSFGYINKDSNPDSVIFTDASNSGWGCKYNSNWTKGYWSLDEKLFSINALELKAIFYGIKTLVEVKSIKHLRVMTDSMTAVWCLNKMGSSNSEICNEITREIWNYCILHEIWISAAHIMGKNNVIADSLSRSSNLDIEWMLNPSFFKIACKKLLFQPNMDLFATYVNTQIKNFTSFLPDPNAYATDAFSINWQDWNFYAFPPFSLLPRVLKKIREDGAKGIVVCPNWPSQAFYPILENMIVKNPIKLSARKTLLVMPNNPLLKHRLAKSLCLLICLVSGKNSEVKEFHEQLLTSYCTVGEKTPERVTVCTLKDGNYMHVGKMCIPLHLI